MPDKKPQVTSDMCTARFSFEIGLCSFKKHRRSLFCIESHLIHPFSEPFLSLQQELECDGVVLLHAFLKISSEHKPLDKEGLSSISIFSNQIGVSPFQQIRLLVIKFPWEYLVMRLIGVRRKYTLER